MSDPQRRPTPEQRAAFRAFVRAHHPDRGGDPGTFAAGVDAFRAAADHSPAAADRPGPVGPLPFPVRVGVAVLRTWRRRHEQVRATLTVSLLTGVSPPGGQAGEK